MSDRRTRRRDRRDLRTRDEVYGEMDDLQQDHPAYYQSAGQAIPNAVYSDQVVASPCQSANHVQIIYDAQGQAYYQPCPVCGQYPSQDADDRLARSPNDANQGQVYYQQYPASGQFPSRDVEDRLVAPPNDPDPDQAYYQQYPASEQYQSQDVNDPPVPPPNVESQGHDTYDDAYDRSSVDVQAGSGGDDSGEDTPPPPAQENDNRDDPGRERAVEEFVNERRMSFDRRDEFATDPARAANRRLTKARRFIIVEAARASR